MNDSIVHILPDDPHYPAALKTSHFLAPPQRLSALGNLDLLNVAALTRRLLGRRRVKWAPNRVPPSNLHHKIKQP